MTAFVIVAAAAALMCVCLCKAMTLGERQQTHPKPRPARRPTGPAVWVDPSPIDPDAPWLDPEAVAQ